MPEAKDAQYMTPFEARLHYRVEHSPLRKLKKGPYFRLGPHTNHTLSFIQGGGFMGTIMGIQLHQTSGWVLGLVLFLGIGAIQFFAAILERHYWRFTKATMEYGMSSAARDSLQHRPAPENYRSPTVRERWEKGFDN